MSEGEEAVCLVSVDGEVSARVADEIKAIDQVKIVDVLAI
jgi:hypothetical protein